MGNHVRNFTPQRNECDVYVLGYPIDPDDPNGTSYRAKIGISSSGWSRLHSIQTANPHKLEMLALQTFRDRDQAFSVERMLHQIYKHCRLQGEWFDLEVEQPAAIGLLLDTIVGA